MGKDQILQVFSNRLPIAQIMILGDETVEKFFQRAATNLLKCDRKKFLDRCIKRTFVHHHRLRRFAVQKGVPGGALSGRKYDMAFPFQAQQESPANHVFEVTVGLNPVPGVAYFLRQGTPAIFGMVCN
jgi:hypothetical protein